MEVGVLGSGMVGQALSARRRSLFIVVGQALRGNEHRHDQCEYHEITGTSLRAAPCATKQCKNSRTMKIKKSNG